MIKKVFDSNQLSKLILHGYKSIASCEIELGKLNVLIGANGAGKSNFIGFFRLISKILDQQLQDRIKDVIEKEYMDKDIELVGIEKRSLTSEYPAYGEIKSKEYFQGIFRFKGEVFTINFTKSCVVRYVFKEGLKKIMDN